MQVQKDLNCYGTPSCFLIQADLVRNRVGIVDNGKTFSINTLKGRVKRGFLNGLKIF